MKLAFLKHIEGNPDLAALIATYPARLEPCWIWTGNIRQIIKIGATTTTVLRRLTEIACEEPLPDYYNTRRACPDKRCVNPSHHKVQVRDEKRWDGLPFKLRQTSDNDLDDLISIVQSLDPRPTPEEYHQRCKGAYTLEELKTAYARIT